jgi:hypothetical protein
VKVRVSESSQTGEGEGKLGEARVPGGGAELFNDDGGRRHRSWPPAPSGGGGRATELLGGAGKTTFLRKTPWSFPGPRWVTGWAAGGLVGLRRRRGKERKKLGCCPIEERRGFLSFSFLKNNYFYFEFKFLCILR